jgi:hypothetical protein
MDKGMSEVYEDLVELDGDLDESEVALKRAILLKSQSFTKMTVSQLEEAIDDLVRLNIQ